MSRASVALRSEKPLANQNGRVNALITAESIIAGFMIAYGALGGQLLIYWGEHERPETTYLAGILVNAIILTCFASIYILFRSVHRGVKFCIEYEAGYNLFKLALFGSVCFVIINAFSISRFTAFSPHTAISLGDICHPLPFDICHLVCLDTCHLVFASGGAFIGYGLFLGAVVWKCTFLGRNLRCRDLIFRIAVLPLIVAVILWVLSCVLMWCPLT
jgi:hypothetical protein